MASAAPPSIVRGVDFVSLPTRDLETSVRFYTEVLGLRCSVHMPERHFAEFEPGTVTIGVMQAEAMGLPYQPNRNPIALHVDDVAAARAALEERGVTFEGDVLDTGVCHTDRHFAEFETHTVTFSVIVAEKFGFDFTPNRNPVALHVEDVAEARATLEARGVEFAADTLDTGVCHMAFFADPDGNALMLHHRYAPRTPGT
jgi:predicted enzyme related to lactoylglutathione lyase